MLNLDHVDLADSFFNFGANSLIMMRAANRLRKELGVKLTLRELFDYPTVKGLATHIKGRD